MTTTFDDWLAACAAAEKGGADFAWEASRGLAFTGILELEGDWTGAVMTGYLRAQPDGSGAALATFTVSGPVVTTVDGAPWSAFTFTLASGSGTNSTGSLPADGTGEGLVQLALFTFITPSGGSEEFHAGGVFSVLGV